MKTWTNRSRKLQITKRWKKLKNLDKNSRMKNKKRISSSNEKAYRELVWKLKLIYCTELVLYLLTYTPQPHNITTSLLEELREKNSSVYPRYHFLYHLSNVHIPPLIFFILKSCCYQRCRDYKWRDILQHSQICFTRHKEMKSGENFKLHLTQRGVKCLRREIISKLKGRT